MATYTLLGPVSGQAQFDQIGRLVTGGRAKLYVSGTTTPKTAYTTPDLSVAHPWPMPLDSAARVPPYYCAAGAYDLRVEDQYGGLIGAQFNALVSTISIADPEPAPTTTIVTGAILALYSNAPIDGWVICNGLTIGPIGSSADTASDDCEDLFLLLWTNDSALTVSGGRGASAAADWAAGKTITTPDLRGCALVGRDAMGTSAAGRITAATTSTPDALGTHLGTETHVLTETQMPSHGHVITVANSAGHTHTGVTNMLGNHTHPMPLVSPNTYQSVSSGLGATVVNTFQTTTDVTQAAGDHGHSFTTDSGGVHAHDAAAADAGSDAAHLNVQPSILITWFIKL